MKNNSVEILSPQAQENIKDIIISETILPVKGQPQLDKASIRKSLKASTWDGVFSTVFGGITGGVVLSNFLLQLGASPTEIGMLCSVPMLGNFLQPLGAYLSEKTTSRRWYILGVFGTARLLWLILVLGIGWASWQHTESHALVSLTLVIILATNFMGALGSASWLSWMAALVPQRLRGRYFSIRNSATSLTNLISVPLLGLMVSAWPGGAIQGYAVVLLLGVVAGLISLGCQFLMTDVNPQQVFSVVAPIGEVAQKEKSSFSISRNFLIYLLYFSFWTFAVNIAAPFFSLYMLDDLGIDVSLVTVYTSLVAAAGLVMLVVWGKLADRFGSRPIMILVGWVVALMPLLWLAMGNDAISLWVWFPLFHLLMGGAWAAINLCNNNLQMALAPERHQATYFAFAAAVAGVSGALGTTLGGFLAQYGNLPGGLPGLFALSAFLRTIALLLLFFIQEPRSSSIVQVLLALLPIRPKLLPTPNPLKTQALPQKLSQV